MALCKECEELQEITNIISCTLDEDGNHHSFDDKPSYVDEESKQWYVHGKLHRIGKPAIIWSSGREEWFVDDNEHHEDGPSSYNPKYIYDKSIDSWCWKGEWAQEIYKKLHIGEFIIFIYESPPWRSKEKSGLVYEKINKYFYRVLCGDEKILVVSLDKTSEA